MLGAESHEPQGPISQPCCALTRLQVYLCLARAAKEIGDHLREEEFLTEAVKEAPSNPLYKQLRTQSTVAHMRAYYAKHVANTPLEPAWLGEQRGKGFTARKDLAYVAHSRPTGALILHRPGVTLLRESPLVSVRSTTHCFRRSVLTHEQMWRVLRTHRVAVTVCAHSCLRRS